MKIQLAALFATILAAPLAAHAQTGAPPSPAIETGGFRTGMTEEEFRAALANVGFPAQDVPIAAQPPAAITASVRSTLGGMPETEFFNSIVARKTELVRNGGYVGPREMIQAAFFGPGNDNRVWAIQRVTYYAPADAPSFQATLSALTAKYGTPSSVNQYNYSHWWWDANGRLLPAKARPECERAIHDTQMLGSNSPWDGMVPNRAATKYPPFPGIAKSDCVYGLRAGLLYDANNNVASLSILVVALRDANMASMKTGKVVGDLMNAAKQKATNAANARKPDL